MKPQALTTKLDALLRSIACAIAFLACTETAAIDINQHGLTGSWYEAAMSGQGIMLEVYPNAVAPGIGFLQGSWFTFSRIEPWDYDWEHRWYTFSGSVIAGESTATLTVYQNVGGNFDAPPATAAVPIGTVVLSFADCGTATMQYAFTDDTSRTGAIPLTRLTPNVTCSTSGETLASADFGYSGNWFDPATSGQGFVFELNPTAAVVFFAWFTYASGYGERGQVWYTGEAADIPESRTFPVTLYGTVGNSFDSGDPHLAFNGPVGTATVTFTSCDAAKLVFTIDGFVNGEQSGTINLSRVGPTPADCGP